ncbi:MAG TPA: AraC family transcriptional regulator [Chryseolinea sp.]|nr:AraC family transcriptional regulator [Chryseolinea sp.]
MNGIPVRHINTAQKEPELFESFGIRDLKTLLAGKDMVQEIHRHDFFYVLVIKKGAGDHDIDFTSHTICDNSIFFMRPGQVHRLLLKAGSAGYLMQFRDEFYFPHDKTSSQLLRKASKVNHYRLTAKGFQKLITTLGNIFQEYAARQDGYREIIKANMGIFFIELSRQQSGSPLENTHLYIQERLDELLTLLEAHIFNRKLASEYAAMMNLSTYQLNAITRETLGKSCSQLINEQIILEAKRYLQATSNQVNQIADHLGYEDVSYFIRFFKKHTGYSPEAFRNNTR